MKNNRKEMIGQIISLSLLILCIISANILEVYTMAEQRSIENGVQANAWDSVVSLLSGGGV